MLLALVLSAHAETSYALGEAGITLDVGPGWHMSRWSDWDFVGRTNDNGVFLDVWTTTFQQEPTAETAEVWAKMFEERVVERDHVKNPKIERSGVEVIKGRPTLRVSLSFDLASGGRAVLEGASFALEGKTVHMSTMSAAANRGRATSTLTGLLDRSPITKPAADLTPTAELKTDAFTLKLPTGWRAPLASEATDVQGLFGQIAEKEASKCAAAVHPRAPGSADLMLVCAKDWKLPILDEASFEDVSALTLKTVFGKAAEKLEKPERVELSDRSGILVRPSNVLRLGIVPYKANAYAVWMASKPGQEAALDTASKAAITGISFAGGGAPEHSTAESVVHTIQYNPTHPGVLACVAAFLAMFGGLVALIFKKRDHHPTSYMHH